MDEGATVVLSWGELAAYLGIVGAVAAAAAGWLSRLLGWWD